MNQIMRPAIALVAHDGTKRELIEFARRHADTFTRYPIIATDGTAALLRRELAWSVTSCGHGPSGGDVAVAVAVATGEIAAAVFLLDPHAAHPHAADFQALIRQCCVHNVPVALNTSTAAAVMSWLGRDDREIGPTTPATPNSPTKRDIAVPYIPRSRYRVTGEPLITTMPREFDPGPT